MKLHTPDNNELMHIHSIERQDNRLIIHGVIMESMPTKAVLKPEDMRAAFSLLGFRLILDCIVLLFQRSSR